MSLKRRFLLVFALASVGIAVMASSASATFHLQKIREISPGTDTSDDSYVEIQAYADFQNFLHFGAALHTCAQTCASPQDFTSFTDVANGHTQDTVLFGDSGMAPGSKDFNVNLNLDAIKAGGAVCYTSEPGFSDCVSWGTFNDNAGLMAKYGTTAGTPAPALTSGMALRRSIVAGCPTMLEPSDDTDNSATDFSAATPNPRSNAVTPTETPCAPAGGGGAPPSSTQAPASKKKKCKKAKKRAAAAKKCKKKRK